MTSGLETLTVSKELPRQLSKEKYAKKEISGEAKQTSKQTIAEVNK